MHIPVLKNEVIEILNPQANGIYLDATVGEGGHLMAIAKTGDWQGKYLGIDLEPRNIESVRIALKKSNLDGKIILENTSFINIDKIAKKHKINKADGILFDLGMCSWQIDDSGKGFSFSRNEPLDMRFGEITSLRSAKDILNKESEFEIARIIKEYGEEKYYRQIAKGIIETRKRKQISTTSELVDIIAKSIPISGKRGAIHPATRTFQGLRIAVNNELDVISQSLPKAWKLLKRNGILIVISFHSLEDRLIKNFFKTIVQNKEGRILTKKPITPSQKEILQNHRSRSAKMRAVIKK